MRKQSDREEISDMVVGMDKHYPGTRSPDQLHQCISILLHFGVDRVERIISRHKHICNYFPTIDQIEALADKIHDESKGNRPGNEQTCSDLIKKNAKQAAEISDVEWLKIKQINEIALNWNMSKQERAEKLIKLGYKNAIVLGKEMLEDLKNSEIKKEVRKQEMADALRKKTLLIIEQQKADQEKSSFDKI